MSDQIPGEVLVPASRFIPKCEHCDLMPEGRVLFGGTSEGWTVGIQVWCAECRVQYTEELPYGVEGVPHGQANPELKLVDGELKLR